MENLERSNICQLYSAVRRILLSARQKAYAAVNFAMVQCYWEIGRLISEEELKGKHRADYGKQIMEDLSARLTEEFGKGFDVRELRRYCQLYRCFPIWDTLCPEFSFSHYHRLITTENQEASYMNETIQGTWSEVSQCTNKSSIISLGL